MRFLNCLFYFLLFSFSSLYVFSQKAQEKSLLWRVTGHGLSKPSYLFGTMHLTDKRVFQFGDSVYNSIENTEGFAMELDPNSMMDSLLTSLNNEDTSDLLSSMIDKKQYDTVAKKLEKRFGIPSGRITRKMLMDERTKMVYKKRHVDDMNAAVDLYLYNIAHKMGKWVGGIEDIDDQSGVLDELGKKFDVNEFLSMDETTLNNHINKMIEIYVSEDIDKIEKWEDPEHDDNVEDLAVKRRNIKMARRMDSLSKIRTTFFAVGAAHLPGDSGVISLLREKGFKVDPVFSSKKIAPKDYSFIEKEYSWITVTGTDSVYTLEMPGRPTDINKFGKELNMKMYIDMGSNIYYLSGFRQIDSTINKDSTIKQIAEKFFTENVNSQKKKPIVNNGVQGIEISGKREGAYCRLQAFIAGDKEYFLIVTSADDINLFSKDADRFLESLVMNKDIEIKTSGWISYTDSAKAFSVSFPSAPAVNKLAKEKTQKNWTSTLYSSFDSKANIYYILAVNELQKGYILYGDSIFFNQRYETLLNDTSNRVTKRKSVFNDLPAMEIVSSTKKSGEEIVTSLLMINNGNRNYSLVTVTDKKGKDGQAIKQFSNSFKILPYKTSEWKVRQGGNNRFSTWAPSTIDPDIADTSGLEGEALAEAIETDLKREQFLAHDVNSTTTYNINAYPISPYYWTDNDSTFYKKEAARYYTDTADYKFDNNAGKIDSLIYIKTVKNGNIRGRELMARSSGSNFYKKVRIIRNGDSAYHLFAFVLKGELDNKNNLKFFDDFVFNKENPGHLFENKTSKILSDLESDKLSTFEDATNGLLSAKFTSSDLPLLLPALIKDYRFDTLKNYETNGEISRAIEPLMNNTAIQYVENVYDSISLEKGVLKMILLGNLAGYKTQSSYNTLEKLLLKKPVVEENNYTLAWHLKDSLKLSATLFPGILELYSDSIMAPLIIDLSRVLIDSSLLEKKSLITNALFIYATARRQIQQYRKYGENYYGPFYTSVIKALALINSKESEELLRSYMLLKNSNYVSQNAALALLKSGKKISPTEIDKIASQKSNRVYFFEELKEIGKENLFPLKWHSQKSFAESYIYNYITDEDEDDMNEPSSIEYVTEKISNNKRYFFYKVTFDHQKEKVSHLAICGPFDTDKNVITIDEKVEREQVFYDEDYNPGDINALFKSFLQEN